MAMKNGAYDAARLMKLYESRWALLGDWRNRWERQSYFIMPQQRSFTSSWSPGSDRNERYLYDSTALEANERLATRLHEALTSPASPWFRISLKDEELASKDAVREWLEECERTIRQELSVSNFDAIMGQFYLDLGALGTGAIACEEASAPYGETSPTEFYGVTFKQVHLGNIGVAQNANGSIDEVFQKFDMTAEQWVNKFGDKAPESAKKAMSEGAPDKEIKCLVCRFPRDLDKPPAPGLLLPKERPWAEVWIDFSHKEMVFDGGTHEQAVFVGRWRAMSEDLMGYGPGQRALPTVRSINEAVRLEFAAWAKSIDPPIKSTQNNVVGDLDLRAGGLTNMRKLDATEQWDIRPDLQHHMIQLEDLRYQVREMFRYHSLELPPREQVGEMTAYEVAKRIEQVYRALGPTLVQLQADILNPLVQRVFGIMYRRGALPMAPEEVEDEDIAIQYVGPMAMAQKANEIEAIDRFISDALAMAQSGVPEAMDIVDFDKAQRYKAEIMGVPALATRSEEEVEEIRDERNAAMEQQAAQEAAIAESQVMSNLGNAVGQDVMTEAVAGMGDQALAGQ